MTIQTASKTPSLGLARPVDSDAFNINDISESMMILDQNPGILTVQNYASLPTGWGPTQHGRRVWQADRNVEWVWSQPSSSQTGSWLRTFKKGMLASNSVNDQFTTSALGVTGGNRILSVSLVTPAKCNLKISLGFDWVANAAGIMGAGIWINNRIYDEFHMLGYGFNQGKDASPNGFFAFTGAGFATETNLLVELSIHGMDPKVWNNSYSGKGGTVHFPRLYVEEV